MIRSLVRNVGRLVAAVVLLALAFCALEVGLRATRIRAMMQDSDGGIKVSLTQPSRTTYLEPVPLLNLESTENSPVSIQTSEWGTRGPSPVVPKPSGTYRILCLGSRDTFGEEILQEETFCQLLATSLQSQTELKVEVVNAGCPQAGPLCQILRLRRTLLALQPDLILLNVHAGDLSFDAQVRAALHLDTAGHPAFASHPQFTTGTNPLLTGLRNEYITAGWLLGEVQNSLPGGSEIPNEHWAGDIEGSLTVNALREAPALARSSYAACAIALLPDIWEMQSSTSEEQARLPASQLREQLQPVVSRGELIVLDGLPSFRAHAEPRELFERTGNLSAAGHRLYAAVLAQGIVRQFPGVWNGTAPQSPGSASPLVRESTPIRR